MRLDLRGRDLNPRPLGYEGNDMRQHRVHVMTELRELRRAGDLSQQELPR
jgi:hypothetical protein